MAKQGKLKAALDAHRGVDHEKERQKKLARNAQKKRAQGAIALTGSPTDGTRSLSRAGLAHGVGVMDVEAAMEDMEGEVSGSGEGEEGAPALDGLDDISSDEDDLSLGDDGESSLPGEGEDDVESDGEEDYDEEEDIPMSDIEDLDPEDREDIIPHQRLTINNTTALLKAHKSIALPDSLPFSATQAVTSAEQIEIADVHDDLTRELAFYSQCLDAAVDGRARLKKEGVPFSRPTDYFAEMVKSDEHMGRIKARMIEQAADKKAAAEARKQRDLKKFGKQVQVARQQERDKQKRDTLDRINVLKRKRKDAGGSGGATNEEDMFDVALDNEAGEGARGSGRSREKGGKRAKKDAKFGFGGKKRFAKSNDATSSGDIRAFSVRKMKAGLGGGKKAKTFRPGKSKRAKAF